MTETALVYGMAISGEAVARALHDRGVPRADRRRRHQRCQGRSSCRSWSWASTSTRRRRWQVGVASSDIVCPAPGVAETHPVIVRRTVLGKPIRSEIDLAYEWEQQRIGGARPMLAVTGTDGKTTTTLMAAAMLRSAGLKAAARTATPRLPLIAALDSRCRCVRCRVQQLPAELDRPLPQRGIGVVEPRAGPPELARFDAGLRARQGANVEITTGRPMSPLDTPATRSSCATSAWRRATVTFGTATADYHVAVGSTLTGPAGRSPSGRSMTRDLPHDVSNALAAAAISIESGLATAQPLPRRWRRSSIRHTGSSRSASSAGARWFNDSKATTPHAAITAIRGSPTSCCWPVAATRASISAAWPRRPSGCGPSSRSARQLPTSRAFAGWCPVTTATLDGRSRRRRRGLAGAGDVVLLSPGCASFDWYKGYAARGDDFARAVRARWRHDDDDDDARRRRRRGGGRSHRLSRRHPTRAPAHGRGPAAAAAVLRDRGGRRRLRDARSGDGAVGIVGALAAHRTARRGRTSSARPCGPCSAWAPCCS